ncbi:MAG TPA: bifunctional DNA primase/polymerase, partial [Ktedonobacteraceae bacterium]
MNDAVYVNNAMANEVRRNRTLADFALLYADEGFRVLPLQSLRSPGCCSCGFASCSSVAKHPRTFKGVKDATSKPEQVREWWRLYPDANIGIATGQGILVIDIDPKHGGSLEALNAILPLPPTATVHTGGGGFHLYFMCSLSYKIRNSVGKLAPGIDVRGENGYVVAPPSIHASGNRYYWESHKGFAIAPPALLALVEEKAPPLLLYNTSPYPGSTPISSNDTAAGDVPTAVASPAPILTTSSTFIPEGKRNARLVSLAGSLRNQEADEEMLLLVLQAINTGYCKPPLPEHEVRQICKSAANWTPGVSGKLPSNGAIIEQVEALMSEEQSSSPWAIPGLLPEGVSLLAGKPKMGKSWLALSLAISVAHGGNALGTLPTNQGAVLYLGLEDNKQRICARVGTLAQGIPPALFWSGSCAPLTMGGLTDLETWIANATTPRLIVIDTFARVRAQNSTSNGSVYADDYAAITPLKSLAEQYHLSILLIHHLRKSVASDPMDEISGSTGLT